MKHEKSFEEQMNQLEQLVNELSHSEDLEESLQKFEQGLTLAKHATDRLRKIENRLIEIKQKFTDEPVPKDNFEDIQPD